MDPGELDCLISIERYVEKRNELNEPVKSWVELARVWASRKVTGGGEAGKADQTAAARTVRFKIHWSPQVADLNEADRIVSADQIHAIVSVLELGRKDALEVNTVLRPDGA